MSASAIYEGWVAHKRRGPVAHSFRYRVFLPLFDLGELPELLDPIPLWSARRPAPARWRCDDFLGDSAIPLAERARNLSRDRIGRRPAGPVRLLANPRYLGVGFNPVSFFFLYGHDGNSVEAVIAEVTNTPWGERHSYVLDGRARDSTGAIRAGFQKAMHVSPFQPMEQSYEISVADPGERMRIVIRNVEAGSEVFTATMALRRRELTRTRMVGLLLRYPPSTIATLARIYANAARLGLKGARFHPHPRSAERSSPTAREFAAGARLTNACACQRQTPSAQGGRLITPIEQ